MACTVLKCHFFQVEMEEREYSRFIEITQCCFQSAVYVSGILFITVLTAQTIDSIIMFVNYQIVSKDFSEVFIDLYGCAVLIVLSTFDDCVASPKHCMHLNPAENVLRVSTDQLEPSKLARNHYPECHITIPGTLEAPTSPMIRICDYLFLSGFIYFILYLLCFSSKEHMSHMTLQNSTATNASYLFGSIDS